MKKQFKTLCKLVTAIATIGGILYIARDQIKDIIDKIKEVTASSEPENDDFDEPFDDLLFLRAFFIICVFIKEEE